MTVVFNSFTKRHGSNVFPLHYATLIRSGTHGAVWATTKAGVAVDEDELFEWLEPNTLHDTNLHESEFVPVVPRTKLGDTGFPLDDMSLTLFYHGLSGPITDIQLSWITDESIPHDLPRDKAIERALKWLG